jgi:hypothetical protein
MSDFLPLPIPNTQSTDITSLQTSQGVQDTDITSLQTSQGVQDTDITSLQTSQGVQDTDITSLQTSQGVQDTDITSLQTKTQNISLTDTDATKTTIIQDLDLRSASDGITIIGIEGQNPDIAIDGTTPGQLYVSTGFEFTTLSNLENVRFLLKTSQRGGDTSNRIVSLFQYDNNTSSYTILAGVSIGRIGSGGIPPVIEGDYNISYDLAVSFTAGVRYAILIDAKAGDFFSDSTLSPLTVDSNINLLGSLSTDGSGAISTAVSTNDGYSPFLSLQYEVAGVFDTKLSCGLIDNKNGTIINVSNPTNLQDVSTKNYVDTAISAIPPTDLTELETKTQNTSNTTTAGNTIRTGDQQFLLGDALTGDSLSITGGAVGDPFVTRIMDMNGLGVNIVAPLNTSVIRPDVNISRDIGTTALRYKDIYSVSSISDYSVNNINSKPTNTVSAGKTYVNGTSESLVYVYNNIEYPIAGNEVKKVYKGSGGTDATIYEDDTVMFMWDATNKQPKFRIKVLPNNSWIDAIIHVYKSGTTYVSSSAMPISDTIAYWFTTNGILDTNFNLNQLGSYAKAILLADSNTTYPSYNIEVYVGSPSSNVHAVIERR